MKHVDGKVNSEKVFLYALSTCIWCRKTKKLLEELGVEYDYEDVDLLDQEAQDKVAQKITDMGESESYPFMIIGGKKVIKGFEEEKIRREFSK